MGFEEVGPPARQTTIPAVPDAVGNKSSLYLWDIASHSCLSREAFHPKSAVTIGYAKVMEQKLRDIGYGAI
ncbi:hypothetical protein [Streptomyces sp. SPB4]|uniref:hypothetical protein n=1 Tax=Streptomyces sp. SPB4 TaxID=2940553 RepID=UPI002474C2AB|nr:hypothetical protein [Streptomyces sp. SPB4]